MRTIKFSRSISAQNEFIKVLNKRIKSFMKENNLKEKGGYEIKIKAILLFTSLAAIVYASWFWIPFESYSLWLVILSYLILYTLKGILMAGIGMGVMHDGSHGTFSSKKWLNKLAASSILLFAGTPFNWDVQHVKKHHSHTNISPDDEDMDAGRIIRFSWATDWKRIHSIQKYPWLVKSVYSLLTVNWAITTDFNQTKRYLRENLDSYPKKAKAWTYVVLAKTFLICLWFVLPISLGVSWYFTLGGFLLMHFVSGKRLALVFQPAHINSKTAKYADLDEVDNHTKVHQFETSSNFGTNHWLLTYYSGGLNYQIEHHVFPNICHTNYRKFAHIVKNACIEFGIPYHEFKSHKEALKDHFLYLKIRGMYKTESEYKAALVAVK